MKSACSEWSAGGLAEKREFTDVENLQAVFLHYSDLLFDVGVERKSMANELYKLHRTVLVLLDVPGRVSELPLGDTPVKVALLLLELSDLGLVVPEQVLGVLLVTFFLELALDQLLLAK
jgi:hypothetical protein